MGWLANLDTKAARWPVPVRWLYLGVKWYLVVIGSLALFYAWSQNETAPAWLKAFGESVLHAIDF
jgi:hypothetical protein